MSIPSAANAGGHPYAAAAADATGTILAAAHSTKIIFALLIKIFLIMRMNGLRKSPELLRGQTFRSRSSKTP